MNRLNSVATRMGPDLRDAIEAMPGLGGVALWVKFLDSDDPELITCTDGIHVEAGPGYEKYDDAERRFIVLHELLHVALAHPARGRELERRTEDFDAGLYNIACDAIINAALNGIRGVHIPDGAVTLGELLSPLGYWKKEDSSAEVVRQWSSEALYRLLEKNRERIDLRALDPNAGSLRNTAARWKEGISDSIACTGNKCIAVGVCGGKRTAHLHDGRSDLWHFHLLRIQLLLLTTLFRRFSAQAA